MPTFLHRMDTRRLRGSDMKRLVRILRHVPDPTDERFERKEASYRKHTKEDIHNLPSRLRSSRLSFGSTNLCSMHKGLNHNLINDIWQWLRHEFEGAIGKFLYPLIMSNRLTAKQEWNVRQLEPVLEMWNVDFSLEASAPPGHEPVSHGSQWEYQRDGCPACMMARIGSDEHVLFALFANMVGRFNTKSLTSTGGWKKTRSKRLRFVRYWVKATHDGDTTLSYAGELGLKMKQLSPPSPIPTIRPARNTATSKRADEPVHNLHSSRPARSTATFKRADESVYDLHSSRHTRNPSIKTTSTFTTIASYTGGPSAVVHLHDPLDNPIYDAKTKEDRVEYYRRQLRPRLYDDPVKKAEKAESTALPLPKSTSMYSEFGNTGFDGGRHPHDNNNNNNNNKAYLQAPRQER
ncbi:conserved hypothetical protein [Pyrenophora tritici-repentis Pt-1C-BFP]|uniref:Uncharacterized protein n=1 Tax=Pyrenophora tritici-repentis (strain Pt-1C-BFP) TaxID=426418 RepID=B2WKG2_PYRTR|nr:uncharacterized protein PTRG_10472 [Pyrenophora tritici-repentis Pt-1C-BFP]EDU43522.1 conserved hypothetical protein [Pyrenophora tritici-repentis Pt-1C-BFP]